jgi:hypothetical protein
MSIDKALQNVHSWFFWCPWYHLKLVPNMKIMEKCVWGKSTTGLDGFHLLLRVVADSKMGMVILKL